MAVPFSDERLDLVEKAPKTLYDGKTLSEGSLRQRRDSRRAEFLQEGHDET
jgi:hypothetical protein